jgi:hypothetical protein
LTQWLIQEARRLVLITPAQSDDVNSLDQITPEAGAFAWWTAAIRTAEEWHSVPKLEFCFSG